MGLRVNVRDAFGDPAALLRLRLASQNARHALAKAGVARIQAEGLTKAQVKAAYQGSPRGFYSWVADYGYEAFAPVIESLRRSSRGVEEELAAEFGSIREADKLFGDFDAISTHSLSDFTLKVYPGLHTLPAMRRLFPDQAAHAESIRSMLEGNARLSLEVKGNEYVQKSPFAPPSPYALPEDNPEWKTEVPDIRNIRVDIRGEVAKAEEEAAEIERAVNELYGAGTMDRIKNIVVLGIGANDMYSKDLPELVNRDYATDGPEKSKRRLISVFEPSQLDELLKDANADDTLFVAISRSGETQETNKSLAFAKREGRVKYLVSYVNSGLLEGYTEKWGGIVRPLKPYIGGRYMWAKGLIVLVPFKLAASKNAWEKYTAPMIELDESTWPVGPDTTIIDLAKHLFLYGGAYNIFGLFATSNHPILNAGLRQLFQLHNEAVGKIRNGMLAFGPGMEMLPFAHAGADGVLGSAVSAQLYGAFIFDTSIKPEPAEEEKLRKDVDLLSQEEEQRVREKVARLKGKDVDLSPPWEFDQEGLTKELLQRGCVFPNHGKFTFSGSPNFMLTMDGVGYRKLAALTFVYQNLMYPYLIMNGTNPDSNPNVAMVRDTTKWVLVEVVKRGTRKLVDVVLDVAKRIMRG